MHAKHTPAPWHKAWGKVTDSEGKAICMVTYRKNGPCNDSLIAAAPDMLAALREARVMVHAMTSAAPASAPWNALLPRIDAAIARATGK